MACADYTRPAACGSCCAMLFGIYRFDGTADIGGHRFWNAQMSISIAVRWYIQNTKLASPCWVPLHSTTTQALTSTTERDRDPFARLLLRLSSSLTTADPRPRRAWNMHSNYCENGCIGVPEAVTRHRVFMIFATPLPAVTLSAGMRSGPRIRIAISWRY